MSLRPPTEELLRQDRILRARNKIDLAQPGALEELQALDAEDRPEPKAYEGLAKKYAMPALQRHAPVDNERLEQAYKTLVKGTDKAELSIRFGHQDLGYEDPDRISTGSLMLDYITNGGLPRAAVTQLKGKPSRGKTFVALKASAATLEAGGSVLWVSAERFNASWARTCGNSILIPKVELDRLGAGPRERAEAYNSTVKGAERFGVITGKAGDEVLQKVVDAVVLNTFDLIVVDSIAVLRQRKRLEQKNVGHEFQGGEAKLINDFCSRVAAAFNAVESRRGANIGTATKPVLSEGPRTAIVVINQVREQGIGSYVPRAPDAPGGMGLRHEKVLDLNFLRSEDVASGTDGAPYARRTIVKCDKSKVGPPLRQGMIEIQYRNLPGVAQAGQYGWVVDLMGGTLASQHRPGIAEQAGLIAGSGSWFTVGEGENAQRFQGRPKLLEFLAHASNQHVVAALRQAARQWILEEA